MEWKRYLNNNKYIEDKSTYFSYYKDLFAEDGNFVIATHPNSILKSKEFTNVSEPENLDWNNIDLDRYAVYALKTENSFLSANTTRQEMRSELEKEIKLLRANRNYKQLLGSNKNFYRHRIVVSIDENANTTVRGFARMDGYENIDFVVNPEFKKVAIDRRLREDAIEYLD